MFSDLRDRSNVALEWDALLRDRMLPYWLNTTVNSRGGYQVHDPGDLSWRAQIRSMIDGRNDRSQNESLRGLVSQARLLWVFSHAHDLGYSTPQHDYLKAAAHGYTYLIETMLDRRYLTNSGHCERELYERTHNRGSHAVKEPQALLDRA